MEEYKGNFLKEFQDAYAKQMFGRTKDEATAQNICTACGKEITGFRDVLSEKEYGISGFCQQCQDEVFGV